MKSPGGACCLWRRNRRESDVTGTFRFDELETITSDGRYAIWTAYEGEATVDGAGNIIGLKVLARDRCAGPGRFCSVPICPDDGDIWTDIVRSLGATHQDQIAEAAAEVRIARTIREPQRAE